jgi:hypothetical protein
VPIVTGSKFEILLSPRAPLNVRAKRVMPGAKRRASGF